MVLEGRGNARTSTKKNTEPLARLKGPEGLKGPIAPPHRSGPRDDADQDPPTTGNTPLGPPAGGALCCPLPLHECRLIANEQRR